MDRGTVVARALNIWDLELFRARTYTATYTVPGADWLS